MKTKALSRKGNYSCGIRRVAISFITQLLAVDVLSLLLLPVTVVPAAGLDTYRMMVDVFSLTNHETVNKVSYRMSAHLVEKKLSVSSSELT